MKNFERGISPYFFYIFRKGAEKRGTHCFSTTAAFRDAFWMRMRHIFRDTKKKCAPKMARFETP